MKPQHPFPLPSASVSRRPTEENRPPQSTERRRAEPHADNIGTGHKLDWWWIFTAKTRGIKGRVTSCKLQETFFFVLVRVLKPATAGLVIVIDCLPLLGPPGPGPSAFGGTGSAPRRPCTPRSGGQRISDPDQKTTKNLQRDRSQIASKFYREGAEHPDGMQEHPASTRSPDPDRDAGSPENDRGTGRSDEVACACSISIPISIWTSSGVRHKAEPRFHHGTKGSWGLVSTKMVVRLRFLCFSGLGIGLGSRDRSRASKSGSGNQRFTPYSLCLISAKSMMKLRFTFQRETLFPSGKIRGLRLGFTRKIEPRCSNSRLKPATHSCLLS